MVSRPQHGNLRLVFRLFESHPRQILGLDLNNLKSCLRFPCLGFNLIIDSFYLKFTKVVPKAYAPCSEEVESKEESKAQTHLNEIRNAFEPIFIGLCEIGTLYQ